MSRIQRILQKAERDGSIPSVGELTFVPDPPAPAADVPAARARNGAAPAFPAPEASPLRVATGSLSARLRRALAPGSPSAEQYRTLRTRILQANRGHVPRTLLVTSAARGDGRTQTAASLALTMAQEPEARVCLVDADFRNPQVPAALGVPAGPGLADVLAGRATLDEALVQLPDRRLVVLPGGEPDVHAAELLGTAAMRRVLQSLAAQFDRVVIDAPAAVPLADVALLTPAVDGVVFVVRAGVTTKPAIHEALASVDEAKLLGIVLNDAR